MPGLVSTALALVAALQVASYGGTRVRGSDQVVEATSGSASGSTARMPSGSSYTYGETAPDPSSQYNGRVYDPGTGFHDYGARMYWPQIGRFISADSYQGEPENPASLNRYSYVHNNPYKYTDPTGHCPMCLALIPVVTWCGMGGCQRALQTIMALGPVIADVWEAQEAFQDGTLVLPPSQAQEPAAAPPAEMGARPESLTPAGAGRQGALNEAKRRNNVPTSQQPKKTERNKDRKNKSQPGRKYTCTDNEGKDVEIRDDSAGHEYKDDPSQNRGPHFNDDAERHYDY